MTFRAGRFLTRVKLIAMGAPELDTQLDLVANAERRRVLRILAETDPPVTLRDIALELLAQQHDAPISDVPPEAMKTAHVRLYHTHLPKLADTGVIEYDENRQRIHAVSLDGLEPLLEAITDSEPE